MSKRMTPEFADLLADRILYQLAQNNLFRANGEMIDQITANIRKGREMAAYIILNGDEQVRRSGLRRGGGVVKAASMATLIVALVVAVFAGEWKLLDFIRERWGEGATFWFGPTVLLVGLWFSAFVVLRRQP